MRCNGCGLRILEGVSHKTVQSNYCGDECVVIAQQNKSWEMNQANPQQNFLSFDPEEPHESVSL